MVSRDTRGLLELLLAFACTRLQPADQIGRAGSCRQLASTCNVRVVVSCVPQPVDRIDPAACSGRPGQTRMLLLPSFLYVKCIIFDIMTNAHNCIRITMKLLLHIILRQPRKLYCSSYSQLGACHGRGFRRSGGTTRRSKACAKSWVQQRNGEDGQYCSGEFPPAK